MLRDRLRAYTDKTGLSDEDAAHLVGHKTGTFISWVRNDKPKQPPFDKLVRCAERMLVSMDWLAERSDAPMWDPQLLRPMRAAIRIYTAESPPVVPDHEQRILTLLRWTHQFDPDRYNVLLLAGVAHVKIDLMEKILNGENPALPMKDVPDNVSDFWHLSPAWLLEGKGEPYITDPEPYYPLIHMIQEMGLTQEWLLLNSQVLKQAQDAWEFNRATFKT